MTSVNKDDVEKEWQMVKDAPKSMFKFYNSQKDYQKWRSRFVRMGYITTKPRTSRDQRKEYNRVYYHTWRLNNKDKTKKYAISYWTKRLSSEET